MPRRWPVRYLGVVCGFALCGLAIESPAYAGTVRVCILERYHDALAGLTERHPNLELVTAKNGADLVAKVGGCDAVVGLNPGSGVAPVIQAGGGLKWVQTTSAGVETYLAVAELRDSDILLTNTKIIQGPEIADHAMALLLNLTRDMKFFNEQMARGFERRSRLPLIELRGKTALILGLGGIGTQTAERAAAFGMRVLAVDPKDMPLRRDVEYVGKPDELDALIPEADVIFSCVPLTARSRGMLGRRQFEAMKEGVYVINVSRGGIIDTEALVWGLESGRVRGAGLDVTDPEPLPPTHPLWSMPNVTISPHLATVSDELESRRIRLFRDNLERYLEGRPLHNVVDKGRGY